MANKCRSGNLSSGNHILEDYLYLCKDWEDLDVNLLRIKSYVPYLPLSGGSTECSVHIFRGPWSIPSTHSICQNGLEHLAIILSWSVRTIEGIKCPTGPACRCPHWWDPCKIKYIGLWSLRYQMLEDCEVARISLAHIFKISKFE